MGFGFALYGKQQRAVVPLLCGIALMVYPYFVPNVIALVANRHRADGDPLLFPALTAHATRARRA